MLTRGLTSGVDALKLFVAAAAAIQKHGYAAPIMLPKQECREPTRTSPHIAPIGVIASDTQTVCQEASYQKKPIS
jgi:hypothetical protein